MKSDPAEADKLMKIQRDLDEIKIILDLMNKSFSTEQEMGNCSRNKTIESVLARGERLDSLVEKSSDLSAALASQKAAESLHGIEQSPGSSVMLSPEELRKHEDEDVKVLLATCFYEITRITAPDAPYNDDILRDIFYLIVGTFCGLSDVNSQSFGRRVCILETVAGYRACVVMLDLECDNPITEMFRTFLDVVSDSHEQNTVKSMQTIMTLIIDESEDIQDSLLCVLLSALGRKKTDAAMSACS
ncbi:hypothetical protein ACP4OV_010529 [Aristida adscensionis]